MKDKKDRLLEDQYPTHYLPGVGRQVMKAGGFAGYNIPIPTEPTEAMFRRLIQFNYQMGRQYLAEGGSADSIEEAIRAARDIQDKRGMEHKVGMSSEVEFAPVSVSESLTGKKFELGRLPAPTARVAEPIAQVAADIGPYFTPAAPIAAARDVAAGLKHGDPAEVAMSALGLPGKAAKAAAVAASAMMPEEAEAGKLSAAMEAIERAKAAYGKPSSSDAMGVFHTLYQHKLSGLKELGGIPAPSLAITKPQLAPTNFGDTLLVGRSHLAVPSEENIVHGSDMFSPRFPQVYKEEGKYYLPAEKGFEDNPADINDIVNYMLRERLIGSEEGTEGASGRLIANVNRPITSVEELLRSRHRLPDTIKEHRAAVDDLNQNLSSLGGLLHQYQTNPAERDYSHHLVEALNAKLERGPEAFKEYYNDLGQHEHVPRSIEQTAREVMPDYFEAKPLRGVPFNEFAGALVENDKYGKMAAERLESAGMPSSQIHYSDLRSPDQFGYDIYKKFGEHLFAKGGEANKAGGGSVSKIVEDALLALHNMKSHRMDMVERLGGLPVPSIAIAKPEHGFKSFGDITLVGGKEMATPSRLNPVYGSDVYSPRFPHIDEDTGQIFRGYTPSGYRRYAPVTMENVLREMKGNIRGGENYNYGAGNVRASVTPQFKTLKEVQGARGNIISGKEFQPHKEAANAELFELADKFHPYSKYSNSSFGHAGSFAETLSDIGKGRHSAWKQDYENLPDDLKSEAMQYLDRLRKMPTEYFEAKPQRAVELGEFSGAVVPESIMKDVEPRLKNLGVKEVVPFNPQDEGSQQKALLEFSKLHFQDGGSVIDAALDVVSNLPQMAEAETSA